MKRMSQKVWIYIKSDPKDPIYFDNYVEVEVLDVIIRDYRANVMNTKDKGIEKFKEEFKRPGVIQIEEEEEEVVINYYEEDSFETNEDVLEIKEINIKDGNWFIKDRYNWPLNM